MRNGFETVKNKAGILDAGAFCLDVRSEEWKSGILFMFCGVMIILATGVVFAIRRHHEEKKA